jgi:hypothetical protein
MGLGAILVSCEFAHARGIAPHTDDTQFEFLFSAGCVTV